MPVSGCKEPGIIARQSGESCAGVPIKKRRIHLVHSSSPTPQTNSTFLESDLQQKEQSNSKSESSSNAVSGAVVGDAIQSPPGPNRENCDDRNVNLVQSKVYPSELNLQEPRLTEASFSVSELGGNGKFKMSEKTASQPVTENVELQLAPNEALLHKPQEMRSEKVIMKNDPVKKNVNTELLLAPNDPLVPDVAGHSSEKLHKEEEKLDPQLWNLGLSKGESNFRAHADHNESKVELCANRSHWDLNTTMERWNNSAMVHGLDVVGGSNLAQSYAVKPVICTTEKVGSELEGTLVDQRKQVVVKSEYGTQLFNMRAPLDQHKTEDLLHLSLNTASTLHPGSGQRPPSLSSKLDLGSGPSALNMSDKPATESDNKNFSVSRTVKSEPSDDSNQKDLKEANLGQEKAKCGIVKPEPFEDSLGESKRSSNSSNIESGSHATVKLEPMRGFNQEILLATEGTLQKSELFYKSVAGAPISGKVPCSDDPTCPTNIPTTSGPPQLPTRLGISSDAEASNHSEFPKSTEAMPSGEQTIKQVAIESVDAIASDLVPQSSSPGKKSEVAEDALNSPKTVGFVVVDSESSRLTLMASPGLGSHENGEVTESDAEKISLSVDMQDDCSSDSDVESDGEPLGGMNPKDKHDDGEDDDYEDGEVREPLVKSSSKNGVHEEDLEQEHVSHDDRVGDEIEVSGSGRATTSQVEDKDVKVEDHGEGAISHGSGECDNIITCEKHEQDGSLEPCLTESLPNAVSPASTAKLKTIKSTRRKPLDRAGKEAGPKGCDTELLSDGAGGANLGTMTVKNEGGSVSNQGNVEGANHNEAKSTVLSKVETLASSVEQSKEVNIRGNRSRIINLARTFNGSSPSSSSSGRMRSTPGRLLPSRMERERLTDIVLSGDKLLPRGSRDENSIDGQKFERQRNQDPPVGSTGSGFMHVRGRVDKHMDSSRGDWESDRDFGLDNFNGPTSFRFSGPKNASGVSAAKVEYNGLLVTRDGTLVGGGRGRRKPLNDELPSFRHPPRRRSPTGREGPVSHNVQMVRRPPRGTSPERCLGGGGPDLIALRHEEKFIRGPPDDMIDPMFSRPQPQYQRVGDSFVRGDRSFSPMQRRGPLHVPQIRSKSPPGSRHSPGPWSSPRRRSPDSFGRHDLVHRRASPFYRMERIRSPHQSPCFPEDMVARRHGSPPYMSQLPSDMREMGPTREHDHPRFIPNRSPPGRVLPRSTRRFDIMDPREEMERNEYFGGHMPSGRFHELGVDGIADDRRILERRGVVRPFRPPFSGSDVENFRFHEGGPRPYRFSPDADTEFHDRGNLRVREFERRVKNRPGNAPRRTRSIEEQEENYRHGEQGWHDAGFEDVSRSKRRRF